MAGLHLAIARLDADGKEMRRHQLVPEAGRPRSPPALSRTGPDSRTHSADHVQPRAPAAEAARVERGAEKPLRGGGAAQQGSAELGVERPDQRMVPAEVVGGPAAVVE